MNISHAGRFSFPFSLRLISFRRPGHCCPQFGRSGIADRVPNKDIGRPHPFFIIGLVPFILGFDDRAFKRGPEKGTFGPGKGNDIGRDIGNRIENAIEKECGISASMGYANFKEGMTPEDFVGKADEYLFKFKAEKKRQGLRE